MQINKVKILEKIIIRYLLLFYYNNFIQLIYRNLAIFIVYIYFYNKEIPKTYFPEVESVLVARSINAAAAGARA
jgi:hypothetical protein